MKLLRKKFIEFSFQPNFVTNLDKGFVKIYYWQSWKKIFSKQKCYLSFNLRPKLGSEYVLSFDKNEFIVNKDDNICVQVFHYDGELRIIINRPIDSEHIDTDKFKEVYADICGKSNFEFYKWLNIKTFCKSVKLNFI